MSLDKIPGPADLYIGGLFSMRRYAALKKANITHVISALRLPLDPELFTSYKHLVVELDDVEDENILEQLATTNAFIQEGLDAMGGVLVHCAMGKSRSAALIVAYLLSNDPSTTPAAALEIVRLCRPMAEPNPGFMQQLDLYHRMGCPVDVSVHPMYQRWLYQREIEISIACGRAPETIRFGDETEQQEDGETKKTETEFRCRKCRRSLATSNYLISHTPQTNSNPQQQTDKSSDASHGPIKALSSSVPPPIPKCAHLFLEPLSWMKPELEQGKLEGRIECPNVKCKTNVGKYAWQGMRCNCGQWVVPGISLARGRVDVVKLRTMGLVERVAKGGGKI